METIINFLSGWGELITNVFSEHVFIAAIITILSIALFMFLDKENKLKNTSETIKNAFITFLIWLIAVPIFGWLFTILGKFLEFVLFLYKKFEQQPILFIAFLFFSILIYFILPYLRRKQKTTKFKRSAVASVFFVLLVSVLVPIINFINSPTNTPVEKKMESVQPNNTLQPTAKSGG